MQQHLKKIIFLCIFVTFAIFVWFYFEVGTLLTLQSIKQHRDWLLTCVQEQYALSVMAYLGVYIVDAALFLPAASLLIMLGGFLFGVPAATCYIVIGATLGATVAFLMTRYLLGGIMHSYYGHRLASFNNKMEKNYTRYLLFVRLVPVFPFFLTNVLAGLTLIPLRTFMWTTAVGIIPSALIYASIGQHLTTLNSMSEIFTPKFIAALVALALLSIIPLVITKEKSA